MTRRFRARQRAALALTVTAGSLFGAAYATGQGGFGYAAFLVMVAAWITGGVRP